MQMLDISNITHTLVHVVHQTEAGPSASVSEATVSMHVACPLAHSHYHVLLCV
jgi:hypothetical protein